MSEEKVIAYMRRWAFDGVKPFKERNANGRLAWPAKFKFKPVTQEKIFADDVALSASQPQAAVIPGFRLLPIEPTMEMYEAAGEELYGHSREKAVEWAKEDKFESYAQTGMEAWRVMVAAAPKEPK